MIRFFFLNVCFLISISVFSQEGPDLFFRAVAAERNGLIDSAVYYCDLTTEMKDDTVVQRFKASCLAVNGKYDKAYNVSELIASAGNIAAYLDAARYASLSGKNDEVFICLSKYLLLSRRLPDNLIKTDSCFKRFWNNPEWEKIWKNQKVDEWLDLKADLLYRISQKEYYQLFDVLDEALKKFPDNDEMYYYRFLIYYNTQNYKGAQQNIRKAIKINPECSQYYLSYAGMLNRQKLFEDADVQFRKYLSANKYDILILPEIIQNAIDAGKYNDAVIFADKYLNYFSKDAKVLFKKGMALKNKKDYTGALEFFTKVLYIEPRFADAYFQRGMCYFEQSQWENAFNEFTLTLDLKPRTGEVFYFRGITCLNKGDKTGACRDFERAKSYDYLQASDYMLKYCGGQ